MHRRLAPLFLLACLIEGCSGGGSTNVSPSVNGSAPIPAPTSGTQSVRVSIAIPSKATAASRTRRPQYISAATQSVTIAVNGGTPVAATLTPGSPNCQSSSSGLQCTLTVNAPVGTDTFTEVTYATTNETGTPLSETTTSAPIAAGVANTVNLTLQGVVNAIALALSPASPPQGTKAVVALTVTFKDAAGETIIGPGSFENPVTLADSDTSGATTLSTTKLNAVADAANLTVTYTGAALPNGATFSASASGVPSANVTSATLTPSAPATPAPTATAIVDYPTYAYDQERSGYNPYTSAFTTGAISKLHLGWEVQTGNGNQSQPIIATNVPGYADPVLIVAAYTTAQAYDALNGHLLWQQSLPRQDVQSCGTAGISGTVQYVASLGSLFMVDGNGGGSPNHVVLYKLSVATGQITGQVDVTPSLLAGEANTGHAGMSYANGRIYIGTGSNCEGSGTSLPSWRGRVVSVDPNSMSVLSTFFLTWGHGGNYGGGGMWAWGGLAADAAGNIYLGSGNGETSGSVGNVSILPPFAAAPNENSGYAEHFVKLSGDLSTVEGSDSPAFNFTIGIGDLDYTGTPIVMNASCGTVTATQGKGGMLVLNNASDASERGAFTLSVPSAYANYVGNPTYSPATGYAYAAITSSGAGTVMLAPGLAAIDPCGASIVWHAAFGPDAQSFSGENPRSAPTVTAGGVVFISSPCNVQNNTCNSGGKANGGAMWAVDAASGNVLNNSQPLFLTTDTVRMPATVDGQWMWVYDMSGDLYGYTLDPSVRTVTAKPAHRHPATFRVLGD